MPGEVRPPASRPEARPERKDCVSLGPRAATRDPPPVRPVPLLAWACHYHWRELGFRARQGGGASYPRPGRRSRARPLARPAGASARASRRGVRSITLPPATEDTPSSWPEDSRSRMRREGYEVTADHEETHWWFLSRRELWLLQVARAAAEVARRDRHIRLLDYGCGTGFNLPFLERFGEVCGADVANEALREFQKTTRFPLLDLKGDLRDHQAAFDVVISLDVLEHCDDEVEALREMRSFLVPRGQLVLTVPAYGWLWSGEDVISQHQRRYTKQALLRACSAAGLEALYVSYFNLTILPAMAGLILARRLLLRGALPHSNVKPTPSWLNRLLRELTGREARWVGRERLVLPAGASLVCRLRAMDSAADE